MMCSHFAGIQFIPDGDNATDLESFDGITVLRYSSYAGWSSLVARRAHNPKVVSSNLTPATIFN
jgi:hypothetical protein